MPILRCRLPNGKLGYKQGKKGKCYASKEKASKLALRIREGKK